MNNITGDFHGNGPGRVISVRRGGNQDFSMPGGPMAGGANRSGTRTVGRRHACASGRVCSCAAIRGRLPRRSQPTLVPGPQVLFVAHGQQYPARK